LARLAAKLALDMSVASCRVRAMPEMGKLAAKSQANWVDDRVSRSLQRGDQGQVIPLRTNKRFSGKSPGATASRALANHTDFSKDTYRLLTAIDSAVMVLDAAKGIEQTRKFFEVCRLRDVPIITFVNKLDREGRDPFDLLDEIE
jgi:hypothetical protein